MIKIALAQQDFLVGDTPGNLERIISTVTAAREVGADLVVFPELALTGYPPEDLLLRPGFMRSVHRAMAALTEQVHGIDVVVGHPWMQDGERHNAASWLRDGQVVGRYFKHQLPNYAVFDEARYFTAGTEPLVVNLKGCAVGVLVCEDSWEAEPAAKAKAAGAQLLVAPNASPYRDGKITDREWMFRERAGETGLPMVYCNLVGGQDDLVFDGRSALVTGAGEIAALGPLCEDALLLADYDPASGTFAAHDWPAPPADEMAELYLALARGLRDYTRKNGFSDVVFGLSGGIDSALTLALAADALGPEHVHVVMMPSRYTSQLSLDLAAEQADALGVDYRTISIEDSFEALSHALAPSFEGHAVDLAEENLQARIRGNIVMALSNKFGWLPLATSNKSELAVGYSTIYGDMCGGFSPLKDVLKTRVFTLSRWRNQAAHDDAAVARMGLAATAGDADAIPVGVIERPPSAELRHDQLDEDSLPPYDILDEILHRFVDLDWSIADIVADGFEEPMVRRVAGMVLRNEYKRRQGAPGTRVTSRGFGRDRRYPMTSGWRELGDA
ncbi:NAD+ synthase [Marinihelvus fidelis]|nr:NAD+ synthase [Marinihelvus fidelis]